MYTKVTFVPDVTRQLEAGTVGHWVTMKRAVLALRPILVKRTAVPNLLTNLRSISTSVPAKVFHSDLTDVDLPDFTFSQMCWSRLDQFSEEVLHQN